MVDLFTFEDPFYIFLIVPLLISCLTTSKTSLLYLNILCLLIFCISFLSYSYLYLDVWIVLIITFILIIYKAKDRLSILFSPGSKFNFEGIEKYVYDRDFKHLFTEEEFKSLIEIGQLKKSKEKLDLSIEGHRFDRIFYLATIPAYKSVILKTKDTTISYLHEGSWLGVVEFMLNSNDPTQDKWLVSLHLEKDNVEVVYYEWDLNSMQNLFTISRDYKFINKILLTWTKYLSSSVTRLDDHVSNALKAMVNHDESAKDKANPLSKI